jgi:hypothetical protein
MRVLPRNLLGFLLLSCILLFLSNCATYRSKQFVAVDRDPVQKTWGVKPKLYAFLQTWKYSKEEAQKRIDFFLKFENPFDYKEKVNRYKKTEIEILIDSVFVTFPDGEKQLVMEQHGKEIFRSSTSLYGIGKIIIPNNVNTVFLDFTLKVIDKSSSGILERHRCKVEMKRKESSYPFLQTI